MSKARLPIEGRLSSVREQLRSEPYRLQVEQAWTIGAWNPEMLNDQTMEK